MKKILLIMLLIINMVLYSKDIESIYRESTSSIVLILTYDNNNVPLALGSGFYIEKNLIATNYHVIENSNKIIIKNLGLQHNEENIKVKSYSKELDLAILETSVYNPTYLKLEVSKPNIGESIIAIGNPKGLEGTVSSGIVSGIRNLNDIYNLIQVTSPISPGSSGGPILNMNGDVIGISTYTLIDSQNLNFAISTSAIHDLKQMNTKWEPRILNTIVLDNLENGVTISYFEKKFSEFYENFSLKNNSSYTIKNIIGLIQYFDENKNPINYQVISLKESIPPNMAKLQKIKSFDQSQNFAYKYGKTSDYSKKHSQLFTIEFRLLDYDIIEENIMNDLLSR